MASVTKAGMVTEDAELFVLHVKAGVTFFLFFLHHGIELFIKWC